jgi:anaerobic sulfite reductase subunit C
MKWNEDAAAAIAKVPFFVRRRVRKRVEEEAARRGSDRVTMDHVTACKRKYLENMDEEVKGFQVESCFGPSGCPNRVLHEDGLGNELEKLFSDEKMRDFLKSRVSGPLKLHHEFRACLSDCPNACSRPQIADLGIIAAARPSIASFRCTGCAACVAVCRERAIELDPLSEEARIDFDKCLSCGQCIKACPAGALETDVKGYRILLGGKLGRHPQLAREIEGIWSREQVVRVVKKCIEHYKAHNSEGERFGEVLNATGLDFLSDRDSDPKK